MKIIAVISLALFLICCIRGRKKKDSWCSPAHCYYEGDCKNKSGVITCECIDAAYYGGKYCNITTNACAKAPGYCSGGKCINIGGQPACINCPPGTSGQFCSVNVSGPSDLLLLYNHYAYLGQEHLFLFTVTHLGHKKFVMHFASDRYVVDMFKTDPEIKDEWYQHHKLTLLVHQMNIVMWNDFPYEDGYYHIAKQTFWHAGVVSLKLIVMDNDKNILQNKLYKLLIVETEAMNICQPKVVFPFQAIANDPLPIDVERYSIIEARVLKRCRQNSNIIYLWSIYNKIGSELYMSFKATFRPLLKLKPYSLSQISDGFTTEFRLELYYIEYSDNFYAKGSELGYIKIPVKPVQAVISGGLERQINVDRPFYIDGRDSRDYNYEAHSDNSLTYRWSCLPADNFVDPDCAFEMGNFAVMKYPQQYFLQAQRYLIILNVISSMHDISAVTSQILYVSTIRRLEVFVDCVRNCKNNYFYRNESIHLKARCPQCSDFHATEFEWDTGEFYNRTKTVRGSYFRVLIDVGADQSNKLRVTVVVRYKGLEGSYSTVLTANEPPMPGRTVVTPRSGEAFQTKFFVEFANYYDANNLLYYELYVHNYLYFRVYNDFTDTRLPPADELRFRICDIYRVCREEEVEVTITGKEHKDALKNINRYCGIISGLLRDGHITRSLLMANTIASHHIKLRHLKLLVHTVHALKVLTLTEVRNVILLTEKFSVNSKPITNQHAKVLTECFIMIRRGLEFVLNDQEHRDIERETLITAVNKLLVILTLFATKTENRTHPRIIREPAIKLNDPLAEDHEPPLTFDTTNLRKIDNWVVASIQLHRCMYLLGLLQNHVIFPFEKPHAIRLNESVMYVHAFDSFKTKKDLMYNVTSTNLVLPTALLAEIGTERNCEEVGIQVGALVGMNSFWWYPDIADISSDDLYINIYPKGRFNLEAKGLRLVDNKLQVDMIMRTTEKRRFSYIHGKFSDELANGQKRGTIDSVLANSRTMGMYIMEIPAHSMLYITFTDNTDEMKFELKIGRRPRGYEVRNSQNIIKANSGMIVSILNDYTSIAEGYLATILTDTNATNATFKFGALIHQCLTWSFEKKDPEWVTDYCLPTDIVDDKYLRCKCEHLSIFSIRSYPTIISEDLDRHYLLDELPFNWDHLLFVGIVLLIIIFVLLITMIRMYRDPQTLLSNLYDPEDRRLQISFMSGGHSNATTTSNIRISVICGQERHNVVVYQSCVRPQMRQNNTCKIYLPAFKTDTTQPYTIVLSIVPAGRYPSWYCNRVIITDKRRKQIYVYQVQKWFYPGTVHTFSNGIPMNQMHASFWSSLATAYKNWFQFQPILGEIVNEHLDLFERTCIWTWQFVVTICIVTIYYGRTTLENYEEEREMYRYVQFDLGLILGLGAVTYIVHIIIHIVFAHVIFY